ncbi:hypothetical protein Q7P37_002250 [Cladosporium fusiforme]
MAETVGAVASAAGLISLSMQLVESSQKLKKLYKASRDAPSTIADLCFELETMSLSLRQLESHRNADILGDELLGRCVVTCTRMVAKIGEAVGKIERLIKKSSIAGRVYMAFKEPEIDKLLGEMEQAKSSMSFAYMSFCHSWSVRESMNHAAMNIAQNAVLSAQSTRLQNLEHSIQKGHTTIIARLDETTVRRSIPASGVFPLAHVSRATPSNRASDYRGKRSDRKLRVSLPRWLVDCVWEFGIRTSETGWEFRIHPINLRSTDDFLYEVVKSGNVPAVRKLLESRELSTHDHFSANGVGRDRNMLEIAAARGHVKLCEFLLGMSPAFREDTIMNCALEAFLESSLSRLGNEKPRVMSDALYHLFIDGYGMAIETVRATNTFCWGEENVLSNMLLSEQSARDILASQLIPFNGLSFDRRFAIAMGSKGWPAHMFLEFLRSDNPMQLATQRDARGRTALHWAAEHFGYWATTRWARDVSDDNESSMNSCAKLMIELLALGADFHALSAELETPFARALHHAEFEEVGHMLQGWAEVITVSGLSLHEYVEIENAVQQPSHSRCSNNTRPYGKAFETDLWQLTVSGTSKLSIQLFGRRSIEIWDYHPPPGTWQASPPVLPTMIWHPKVTEEPETVPFWRNERSIEIRSVPYDPELEDPIQQSSFSRANLNWLWSDIFRWTSQDDTGRCFTAFQPKCVGDDKSFLRKRHRRAASAPPPRIHPMEHPSYEFVDVLACHFSTATVHKCLFDGRWKKHHDSLRRSERLRRYCMHGSCQSPTDLNIAAETHLYDGSKRDRHFDWEVALSGDLGNPDIALRYADRFRPELRPILEANFENKRRWVELDDIQEDPANGT